MSVGRLSESVQRSFAYRMYRSTVVHNCNGFTNRNDYAMSSPRLLASIWIALGLVLSTLAAPLPSLNEVTESKLDLWGEAAMKKTNGASYEFFENLIPPPRYVNADFLYYPIVLGAPNSKVKARLISNGSGINVRGGTRSWNDLGVPFSFRVGPDDFRFGDIRQRLQHPRLVDGYLPIVQIDYEHPTQKNDSAKTAALKTVEPPEVYRLEAFGSTDPILASNGVVFVKFSLISGSTGIISVETDASVKFDGGKLRNEKGELLAWFDPQWKWERDGVRVRFNPEKSVVAAIATKPLSADSTIPVLPAEYAQQRQLCADTWNALLAKGINIETPELLVNNAWKNLIIQNFTICMASNLNYSHGNQYQKMYAAETSDAAVPMMSYGYEEDMRRFLPVILNLNDPRLTNHFASHKLDSVCRYYWQTRDAEFVKSLRPRWQKEIDWILSSRGEHGLLPKDNYCTDIEQPVFSFSSNAKCWTALRDMAAVLDDMHDTTSAQQLSAAAQKYKEDILIAVDKSIRYETKPPFVPCALFGAEDIHDPITETRIGSYWDLVANYIIGSGIFNGTERETWVPQYFETHGGLCMGLTRSAATNHTFWIGKHRTNPLYGMRYITDTLRRDDPERALVSFYGMLAHGMTRNTFIGAEGTALQPLDDGGRQFYCPPNTASNGQWLWTLRHLLVQDFDLNDDGEPETLRLAFATPRRWLEDGKSIRVQSALTAFGTISYRIESHLSRGEVTAEIELPSRERPKSTLLRARVPEGWKIISAMIEGKNANPDKNGTINLSAEHGKVKVLYKVTRAE